MNIEEILYNEIYERTKDFGRTHFIKEIMRLQREYQQLKEINEEHKKLNGELREENKKYKEAIEKVSSQIKLYGKYNGEKCTRGFSMMTADFNKLLDILKEVESLDLLKGNKEIPDLFEGVNTITKIPPVPKNMDTSHLQEFLEELEGDKE